MDGRRVNRINVYALSSPKWRNFKHLYPSPQALVSAAHHPFIRFLYDIYTMSICCLLSCHCSWRMEIKSWITLKMWILLQWNVKKFQDRQKLNVGTNGMEWNRVFSVERDLQWSSSWTAWPFQVGMMLSVDALKHKWNYFGFGRYFKWEVFKALFSSKSTLSPFSEWWKNF